MSMISTRHGIFTSASISLNQYLKETYDGKEVDTDKILNTASESLCEPRIVWDEEPNQETAKDRMDADNVCHECTRQDDNQSDCNHLLRWLFFLFRGRGEEGGKEVESIPEVGQVWLEYKSSLTGHHAD